MKKNTVDKSKPIVAVICLVVILSHIAYILTSHQYPQWDEHNYLSLAIKYYDILLTPSIDIYGRMLEVTGYLQPLYSIIIAILVLVFGTEHTYFIALIINGVFLTASTLGVYTLATYIFSNTVGVVAAIVFVGLGNVQFYSHFAYTETAATTFVIWSIVFLYRSRGLFDRKWVYYAGMYAALAGLTRWAALAFILGSVLFVFGSAVFRMLAHPKDRRHIGINIAVYILLAVGLPVALYFYPNGGDFVAYIARNQKQGTEWVAQYRFAEMANTFSTRSVMYYFNILSQNTIGIFILFAVGVLYCVRYIKRYLFLFVGFMVPYIFLTFIAVWKEDRFIVPLYPVFAVIAVSFIHAVGNSSSKIALIIAVVTLSLFNVLGASWAVGPMGKRGLTDVVLPSYIRHPRRIYLTPIVWPPTKEYLNAHLINQAVFDTSKKGMIPVVVGTFTSEPLDNAIYSITAYQNRSLMKYVKLPYDVTSADFVLTKSNDVQLVDLVDSSVVSSFRLIANIAVPMDNSTVTVYKHE